jgi:hypothetical protein
MRQLIGGLSALFYAPIWDTRRNSTRIRLFGLGWDTGYHHNTTATRLLLCSFPNPIALLHQLFRPPLVCHPSAPIPPIHRRPSPLPRLLNQCSTQAKPVTLWWSRHFRCWCALVDFQSGAGKGCGRGDGSGGGANPMPVWMPFCETEGKVSCLAVYLSEMPLRYRRRNGDAG